MEFYSESLFIDSGAHSLYNIHVLKLQERIGKHGRELEAPPGRWTQGDFSFYSLKKGSAFRLYCDQYAYLMKCLRNEDLLFATVDVISNPQLTWEVQCYFEQEHGLRPVPVVHFQTPLQFVERYIEKGYDLIGVGGLGQGVAKRGYYKWADGLFKLLCPASNQYRPIVRTHGFAMTSWELMMRYPWWSVDSASWIKIAAYGGILIPERDREGRWRYDRPPTLVAISNDSPQRSEKWSHYTNVPKIIRSQVDAWLQQVQTWVDEDEMKMNVAQECPTDYAARCMVNLHYLKQLENFISSRENRLDPAIAKDHAIAYRRGFGF